MQAKTSLRFEGIYNSVRDHLERPEECIFCLHTPVGIIQVDRFNFDYQSAFVVIVGKDEKKAPRFLVFADEIICSFAFEVRKKKGSEKASVGFRALGPATLEDQA